MKIQKAAFRRINLVLCLIAVIAGSASAQVTPTYEEWLAQLESQLAAAANINERFQITTRIAPAAFEAGEMEKAVAYSEDLLRQAGTLERNWNTGNAIHVANLVLGRVALEQGKLDDARRYLIEAGKTSGSPQLNTFGPNMLLARSLLEKGEKDVVIEYFDLCSKFWDKKPRLDGWKASIEKGEMPDFGANLKYQW